MKFKKILLGITLVMLLGCSNLEVCPDFDFNNLEKNTSVNNTPFTGRCGTYINGTKRSVQQYVNGIDYGKWFFYYENGKVQTKGRFNIKGNRVGTWKYYYENGNRKQISKYSKEGGKIGAWKYYDENGDLVKSVVKE